MSINYNSKIVTDGLVCYLDAANPKSYNTSENLLLYSEDLTNSIWQSTAASVISNAILSPDGTQTADKIIDAPNSNYHYVDQSVAVTPGTYTFSVYVKAGEIPSIGVYHLGGSFGAKYNVSTNTLIQNDVGITSSISSVGNGWYRIQSTYTYTSATTSIFRLYLMNPGTNYYGTGNNGIYVWGMQVEKKSISYPYKKTTSSAITLAQNWIDLIQNNYAPLLNGTSYSTTNNGCLVFDGVSNYLFQSTPNLPTGSGNITILCWCWPDSTGPSNGYTGLVAYGDSSNNTPSTAVLLCLNTAASTWGVASAYWNNDYNPGTSLPVIKDSWNMVGIIARGAASINNTTLICNNSNGNNTLTGTSSSYTRGLNLKSVNLRIGATDNFGRPMKGKIALVMIFNKELTPEEIQQNFNATRGRFGL